MPHDQDREPFFHRQTVRFGDIDPAGVLYYPAFMHYFHIAMEEFIGARVGIRYADLIQKERVGLPTVRVESEFTGPVKYGDVLDIRVGIARIGGASVVFTFEAFVDQEPVARSRLTKVALDLDSWKAIVIPSKLRTVFEEYLEES